jgi:hypothetical protein
MACCGQVFLDHPQSTGIDRDEANFGALAHHAQMHDTLTAMQILNV